jgi:CRISPR system Cascade subunit CasA
MAHDLLVDPILSWRDCQRRRRTATLPGLLSQLAQGELADFARVRTHQQEPWCMFLTQLAAIALHRANRADPRMPEEDWRELLLELTERDYDPWSLAIPDVSKPAFFQPPVLEGTVEGWDISEWPDAIDVLATAKSHDVKDGLIAGDSIEAWVYAIVTLQTMQGVYGAGKYGVARMRGGYGCRPRVGYAADQTLVARFRRDVEVLLNGGVCQVVEKFRRVIIRRDDVTTLPFSPPSDPDSHQALAA